MGIGNNNYGIVSLSASIDFSMQQVSKLLPCAAYRLVDKPWQKVLLADLL
jgi:hypothetical protein